jgi:hypothetical protein
MKQTEKLALALKLLKELNCPDELTAAIEVWGIFVHNDETKLHNWQALTDGNLVEGECVEIPNRQIENRL